MKRILYTAAHSGFDLGEVPLGGGAAVCQHLGVEWTKTKPFEWDLLGPSLLEDHAPRSKDLVRYSEMDYARFCGRFEKKLTAAILRRDPKKTVVLSNDVSEGPDFKTLAVKGYSLFTIYHVDVVDYFCRIYLHGWIRPESAARVNRWMMQFRHFRRPLAGDPARVGPPPEPLGDDVGYRNSVRMLGLIFQKQQDSVQYSKGLIVPSQRMKEILLRCYPGTAPEKIHVLPWGAWEDPAPASEVAREKVIILEHYPAPEGSFVLLTLSRISPEKGQDRLLKALALWEAQPDFPTEGIVLYLAGESAYMMGMKFEKKLRRLAARLKRCRVHFVGYVSGARKKALFQLSDLYVFPSRHESYGLTLMEALRAGLTTLATPSYGAQEVFQPAFGEMTAPGPESQVPMLLVQSLRRLLSDRSQLKAMGNAASSWASRQKFSDTAARLAALLVTA